MTSSEMAFYGVLLGMASAGLGMIRSLFPQRHLAPVRHHGAER